MMSVAFAIISPPAGGGLRTTKIADAGNSRSPPQAGVNGTVLASFPAYGYLPPQAGVNGPRDREVVPSAHLSPRAWGLTVPFLCTNKKIKIHPPVTGVNEAGCRGAVLRLHLPPAGGG